MNDNQNHRIKKGWTSSRVLSEPGGSGSLMLGMAPPPKKAAAPVVEEPKEVIETPEDPTPVETKTVETSVPAPKPNPPTEKSTPTILPGFSQENNHPVSANAFASGANMNGAQVLTGRPTSRVRYPGGAGGPDSGWTLG